MDWFTGLILLVVLVQTARCQCSGTALLMVANDNYQVFTSVNYPSHYGNNLLCKWRIQADNDTDAVRIEITDASIEYHADCVYDKGQVYDGYNTSADSLGKFCGTKTPIYVTTGNYAMVTLVSDYSLASRGFKARYMSGPRDSLIDADGTSPDENMVLILGAAGGGFLFLVVVMVMIITYVQAKKAKRTRRNRLRRGQSTRIHPYNTGGVWSILDVPAPPAYGEIYSSPLSPPPAYAVMDPNENPSARLPARPQFMEDGLAGNQVTHRIQVHTAAGGSNNSNDSVINTHVISSSEAGSANSSSGRTRNNLLSSATRNGQTNTRNGNSLNTAVPLSVDNTNVGLPNDTDSTPLIGNVAPLATESVDRNPAQSNSLRVQNGQNESTVPLLNNLPQNGTRNTNLPQTVTGDTNLLTQTRNRNTNLTQTTSRNTNLTQTGTRNNSALQTGNRNQTETRDTNLPQSGTRNGNLPQAGNRNTNTLQIGTSNTNLPQTTPRNTNVSQGRMGNTNLSQTGTRQNLPRTLNSNAPRTRNQPATANTNLPLQIGTINTNLSQLGNRNTNLSQTGTGNTNLSQTERRNTNVANGRAGNTNLQQTGARNNLPQTENTNLPQTGTGNSNLPETQSNTENGMQRERSDSNISEVSLPESTRSATISMASDQSDESDDDNVSFTEV